MTTRAALLSDIQYELHDTGASTWSADTLYEFMGIVSRELSDIEGLKRRVVLAIQQYTTEVSISSLTYLRRIIGVYYDAINQYKRNYEQFDNYLKIDLKSVPTITSGTLTGTITFTEDSYDVTGSGTAFSTELAEGYFIGLSSGSRFYEIAHITSDTALVLKEPYEESTGADTVNVTKYRDQYSLARVEYRGTFTIDGTTCNLPAKAITAFVKGVVSKAAQEYSHYYILTKMTGVTTLLSTASTSTGYVSARLTQAIADLAAVRVDIEANLTSFASTLTDVETVLDQIDTDLTSGRALIQTANPAGNVAVTYADYGKTQVEAAKERIEKARSYLESAKTSHDYVDYAEQELNAAAQYVNQADAYIRQAEQSINVSQIVKLYQGWADRKTQEYETEKLKLGVLFEDEAGAYTREN
jgi:hypothetical protein